LINHSISSADSDFSNTHPDREGEAMANSATTNPRPGVPADKYILHVRHLTPATAAAAMAAVTPGAGADAVRGVRGTYRILRTEEVDAKDDPLPSDVRNRVATEGIAAAVRATGDNFAGTAREAAKLSLAEAQMEQFADVKALIATLPAKSRMVNHHPRITTDRDSERVVEEERNVSVKGFLYAASRENDNDFHLIVGRDPNADEPMYMTMEVSGLPPSDTPTFDKLKGARDSYKNFFADGLPGASYDFYDPPIPVQVEGSLFFDMSHAHGRSPGPPSLHDDMPVIWEVHPISKITLEP
jgi:hypothetical protein